MGEKRKQSSNFIVSGGLVSAFSIVILLLMYIRQIPLTNFILDEGNGIYACVYELFMVFVLIGSYSLPLAISKMVAVRINRGQYKNAGRVIKTGMLAAIIFGIAVTLLTMVLSGFLTKTIMLVDFAKFAFMCLIPALTFVMMSSVLQGYFQGQGTMMPTCTSKLIGQMIQFVMCLIFASGMADYGKKAGVVLNENSYQSAFGVSGAAIGILLGEIFTFVFLILLYCVYSKKVKKQSLLDNTKNLENMGSLLRVLIVAVLPFLVNTLVMRLNLLINQRIFNGYMVGKGQSQTMLTEFGIYYGKYHILMQIPLVFLLILALNFRTVYAKLAARGNSAQLSRAFRDGAMQTLVFGAIASLIFTFAGGMIVEILYKGDSVIASKMLRIGSFAILLYGMAFFTSAALHAREKMWANSIGIGIALVLQAILLKVLLVTTDLGVQSLVVVNLVFPLLIIGFNTLMLKKYFE